MITASDLYAIGMESDTAYRLMPELCEQLGIAFPPQINQIGKSAPETLAITQENYDGIYCN